MFSYFIQETRSTSWTMIIVCDYMNIAGAASENTVCKPPVERYTRLYSVVSHFIYI